MAMDEAEMRKRIFAIMTDTTLTDAEKAVKRQELMCGKWMAPATKEAASHDSGAGDGEFFKLQDHAASFVIVTMGGGQKGKREEGSCALAPDLDHPSVNPKKKTPLSPPSSPPPPPPISPPPSSPSS